MHLNKYWFGKTKQNRPVSEYKRFHHLATWGWFILENCAGTVRDDSLVPPTLNATDFEK